MNIVTISGRLTADPKLKTTSTGLSVCTVRLAVDRGYGENKITDFIPVIIWKALAETVEKYCKKGDKIIVTGALYTRNYEDKNGNKRTKYEVNADRIEFCEKKKTETKTADPQPDEHPDDDFPF